jgi:hypothetical protein
MKITGDVYGTGAKPDWRLTAIGLKRFERGAFFCLAFNRYPLIVIGYPW